MKKTTLLFILLSIFILFSCKKDGTNPSNQGSSQIDTGKVPESKLLNLINAYRIENGLPTIPYSKSLTMVAKTHVVDLVENQPNNGKCNLHSWSDKGDWTACCYTDDHAQAKNMWNKPRELTEYKGDGYEIAAGGSGNITPEKALSLWKGSSGHKNVILNKGSWSSPWKAAGAAIYKGYAVVWFGKESDPAQ